MTGIINKIEKTIQIKVNNAPKIVLKFLNNPLPPTREEGFRFLIKTIKPIIKIVNNKKNIKLIVFRFWAIETGVGGLELLLYKTPVFGNLESIGKLESILLLINKNPLFLLFWGSF